MKKTTKILISLSMFLMLLVPVVSFAQPTGGLVKCGRDVHPAGTIINGKNVGGQIIQCGFNDFMTLINDGISFILRTMVLPIAAIMFAYAGFLMVTSGGSTEARGKAKNIFSNTVLGLVIAVAAWLIVKSILSILGFDGAWIFDGF